MQASHLVVNCAIARGLDVVGDRWSLLILRDAFLGRCRFEEFRRHIGVSKTTLSRRLNALITEGILYKQPYSPAGTRFEYKLTKKGMGLFPSSLLAWQWELEWGSARQERVDDHLPYKLVHSSCRQELYSQAICRNCRQGFGIDDVELSDQAVGPASQLNVIKSVNMQRRVRSSVSRGDEDLALANISDLIGDRWTLLLLISAFFGVQRYDAFLKQLNIASNILTTRLCLLVEAGVFERCQYQQNPPRSDYYLTPKGKSLYPIIMAMRQWVIDFLPKSELAASLLHKSCKKVLVVDIQCRACKGQPGLGDVQFMTQQDAVSPTPL